MIQSRSGGAGGRRFSAGPRQPIWCRFCGGMGPDGKSLSKDLGMKCFTCHVGEMETTAREMGTSIRAVAGTFEEFRDNLVRQLSQSS